MARLVLQVDHKGTKVGRVGRDGKVMLDLEIKEIKEIKGYKGGKDLLVVEPEVKDFKVGKADKG